MDIENEKSSITTIYTSKKISVLESTDRLVALPISLVKDVTCKRCSNFLCPPIMLVSGVGNVCGSCNKMDNTNSAIHNAILELIFHNLAIPCRNSAKGCKEKVDYFNMLTHDCICSYRSYNCPLKFKGCNWEGSSSALLDHSLEKHPDLAISGKSNCFKLLINISTTYDTVKLLYTVKDKFILHIKCNMDALKLCYMLYYIGNKEKVSEFSYTVEQTGRINMNCSLNYGFNNTVLHDTEFTNEFDLNSSLNIDLTLVKQLVNESLVTTLIKIQSKNDQEKLDEKLLNSFICPVCTHFMEPPIFQCLAGHNLCNHCRVKLDECPTCKARFANTRNYALEALSNDVRSSRLYQDQESCEMLPVSIDHKNENSKLHTGNSGEGSGKSLQELHNKSHKTEDENFKMEINPWVVSIPRSANQENDSTKNYSSERNRDYSSPDTNWWRDQSKPERSPWDNKSLSKSEHSSGESGKPRRDSSPNKNDSWESGKSRRDYSPNKNDSWDSGKPRRDYSPNKNSSWESGKPRRDFSPNKNYQGNSKDKEYRYFFDNYRKFSINYAKVKEIQGDLFAMSKEYALAHCVAEDMNTESGIAFQFSQQFKGRAELYQQKQRQGGMAILEIDQRPIYYLVTKKLSNGKPTYATLWSSLQKMQKHIEENKVKKLALPRIGCGLDRLEWSVVKPMLEYIFKDTDIEITVCNFRPNYGTTKQWSTPSSSQQKANNVQYRCPVKNVKIPLVQIDRLTAIVYLGSEDGYITEEIASLNTKFRTVSRDYSSANKKVGDVVQTLIKQLDYALYGCIVKKTKYDPFDFINFQKCIARLKSLNSKDNMFCYVGIQAFLDESDDLIMDKIVNMLRCSLINVEIYVCWPGKMKPLMRLFMKSFK